MVPRMYCSSSSSLLSDSSSTQFTRRSGCFCEVCGYCCFRHTRPKWPRTPHLLHFLPFAGHTFWCFIEKFSVPQRKQSFSLQRIWVHFLLKLLFLHTIFDAMCPLRTQLQNPMHPLVMLLVLYTISLVQPDSIILRIKMSCTRHSV